MDRRGSGWLGFAATLSASLLVAIALVLATGWGGDDVGAFFAWTLPFGGLVALIARPLGRRLRGRRLDLVVAAGLGALAGVLWTLVVALVLGPFVLAFGFSIVIAWMAGGAVGLTSAAALRHPRALRVARRASLATAGVALALFLLVPLVFVAFEPGPDLVAELRPGTSDAQTIAFVENVVMAQGGVQSVTQNDPLVLEIELVEDATDAERRRLRETLERSPLVERVEAD
jgi:hypothetical protein